MCHSLEDRPPIPPIAGASVAAERLVLSAADGTRFAAYEARAGAARSETAVLILPDVRGLHAFYQDLAARFAEAGVDALAIDYFGRSAGVEPRTADFPFMDHVAQVTWGGLRADIAAGARHVSGAGTEAGEGAGLEAGSSGHRPIFSVGFCFGGRLSFLCGTLRKPAFAGVIGFYGGPVGSSRADVPAPADVAAQIGGRVLGLFGGADPGIPAESITTFDRALSAAGVGHELVTYPGAPHSFFDRKAADFADAAADAWRRVLALVRPDTTLTPSQDA